MLLIESNSQEKKHRKSRDPRFDSFSGKVNLDLFHKSYSFLENLKKDEISSLKSEIKSKKNISEEEKEKLRSYMGNLKNELHQKSNLELKAKAKKSFSEAKQSNFHAKKKIVKERMLIEKYKNLSDKDLEAKLSAKKKKSTHNKDIGMKKITKNKF